jgi:hypothetical protein
LARHGVGSCPIRSFWAKFQVNTLSAATLTFPAGVQLEFEEGASLAPTSVHVTINGRVRAHPTQQIFGGTGFLSAVTPAGTAPPTVTVSGTPTGSFQFKIQIITTGTLGGTPAMSFEYSLDAGASWSFPITPPSGSSYSYLIASTGVTVTFAGGSYTGTTGGTQNTYNWTSSPPVVLTSLASETINVGWWGAQGNGSADDTWAIQAAVFAWEGAGGGAITFRGGSTYLISAPILISLAGVQFGGPGPSSTATNTVITATASMQAMVIVAANSVTVENLALNCNYLANTGVWSSGDSLSEYRNISITSALFDGFHRANSSSTATIGAIVQSGTAGSPAISVVPSPGTSLLAPTGQPVGSTVVTILSMGGLGVATAQIAFGGGTAVPFTIPSDGKFAPFLPSYEYALGYRLTFPAGMYQAGTVYTYSVTLNFNVNDLDSYRNCVVSRCGTIYGSNNAIDYLDSNPGHYGGWVAAGVHGVAVTGTLATTYAVSTIVGTGTALLATGARTGDFVTLGFPVWQTMQTWHAATALLGNLAVTNGSATVATTVDQSLVLSMGSFISFASEPGVFYQVLSRTATAITLTSPYVGTSNPSTTGTLTSFVTAGPGTTPSVLYVWQCTTGGAGLTTGAPAWVAYSQSFGVTQSVFT